MKMPTTLPDIPELITSKRDQIAALCREFGVARLEVFGSVMTDEFDPQRSDVDFIVAYQAEAPSWSSFTLNFEFRERLAGFLEREVDLVEEPELGFRNRYFAKAVERTRSVVFHDGDALENRHVAGGRHYPKPDDQRPHP